MIFNGRVATEPEEALRKNVDELTAICRQIWRKNFIRTKKLELRPKPLEAISIDPSWSALPPSLLPAQY